MEGERQARDGRKRKGDAGWRASENSENTVEEELAAGTVSRVHVVSIHGYL